MTSDLTISKPLRAVVTGGGGGIGRSIVDRLLADGGAVHVLDVDPESLSRLAALSVTGSVADVGSEEAVGVAFEDALKHLGGLDVLVNNAGISGAAGRVEGTDIGDLRRTLDVNVVGAVLCTKHAVPLMGTGASLVNIASTAGYLGYPLRTAYAASKWALIGLTKTWAMELGPRGIRVNAVCPGSVAGARMDRVIAAEAKATDRDPGEIEAGYKAQSSMSTFVAADDIAATVQFLCSDAARLISGQVLSVDGHTETLRT